MPDERESMLTRIEGGSPPKFDFTRFDFTLLYGDTDHAVANAGGLGGTRRLLVFPAQPHDIDTSRDDYGTNHSQRSWYDAVEGEDPEDRVSRYTLRHHLNKQSSIEDKTCSVSGTVPRAVFDRVWEAACARQGGDPRDKKKSV